MIAIAFPALCVPRDFGVYLVRDLSELRTARAQLFWKYGLFDGLRVYDSEGRVFGVTAARVVKPASALGQRVARLLDLALSVDVEIAAIGDASLPEVRSAVERAVDVDAESFEELSGRSVEWWRATLARVSSVPEVIRAFAANE